jgi:hypothetical protein
MDTKTVFDVVDSSTEGSLLDLTTVASQTSHEVPKPKPHSNESDLYGDVEKQLLELLLLVDQGGIPDMLETEIEETILLLMGVVANYTTEKVIISEYYDSESPSEGGPPSTFRDTPRSESIDEFLEDTIYANQNLKDTTTRMHKERQRIVQDTLFQILVSAADIRSMKPSHRLQEKTLYIMVMIDAAYSSQSFFKYDDSNDEMLSNISIKTI